jgi:hypothetical protein
MRECGFSNFKLISAVLVICRIVNYKNNNPCKIYTYFIIKNLKGENLSTRKHDSPFSICNF